MEFCCSVIRLKHPHSTLFIGIRLSLHCTLCISLSFLLSSPFSSSFRTEITSEDPSALSMSLALSILCEEFVAVMAVDDAILSHQHSRLLCIVAPLLHCGDSIASSAEGDSKHRHTVRTCIFMYDIYVYEIVRLCGKRTCHIRILMSFPSDIPVTTSHAAITTCRESFRERNRCKKLLERAREKECMCVGVCVCVYVCM